MKVLYWVYAASWALLTSALMTLTQPALAQQAKPGIERMYVLYCGDIALNDASSFTPGASGPGRLSVTCYLIKHARGWVLFDTGVGDHIITMPNGQKLIGMCTLKYANAICPHRMNAVGRVNRPRMIKAPPNVSRIPAAPIIEPSSAF